MQPSEAVTRARDMTKEPRCRVNRLFFVNGD